MLLDDEGDFRRFPAADGVRVLAAGRFRTLGDKRNHINSIAQGEYIAHWDDDDWSAPDRLSDQVQRLVGNGAAVTGYRCMEFVGQGRWLYTGTPDFVLGTSLLYRRDWWQANPFPSEQIGEDTAFVRRAARCGVLAVADGLQMMQARDHDGNTSGRDRKNKQWQRLD